MAYPLDRPAVRLPLSLSSSLPSSPLPSSSLFRRLDPHRYLDGRTNAANRKPNNLGHFWQTMPSKCNSNALTRLAVLVWNSKWWPTLLAIRAPPSLPLFLFGFSPRSQFSPMPPPSPLLPFQPWRDLTSERDWRTLRSPPLSYPILSLSVR